MKPKVAEIADGVYRISTFHPGFQLEFNQFVVNDDEPFLMHTGMRQMFPLTKAGVAEVIDPTKIRWIGFSHFESDECGALNDWLAIAPEAQAVCSVVGAMVTVDDFANRPSRPLNNNEAFSIGKRTLRYLATPHLPHGWDAGFFFEEKDRTLFCSDLFSHGGEQEPLTTSSLVGRARETMYAFSQSPLAHDLPYTAQTDGYLQGLADLKPQTLAVMHGSSFKGDAEGELRALAAAIKEFIGGGG